MIENYFYELPTWRQIPDYPNYLVSNDGRVYSKHSQREIKPLIEKRGKRHDGAKSDVRFTLCKDGKARKIFVARLILTAFYRPPKKGEQADHINQNPLDNRLENLRWVSQRENNDNRKGFHKQGIICVETGQIFNSSVEAEYILTGSKRGHGGHIIQAANGKRKTVYGFHWKHLD